MADGKKQILFVDDELRTLETLKRLLLPMQDVWEVSFTHNAYEALTLLETQPVDVLVTDLQMPGMDGAMLLTTVARQYPQTIRLLMADQTSGENIYQALGPVHQYLTKPCTLPALKAAITHALELRERLSSHQLNDLVTRIGILPTLPSRYLEVTQALNNRDVSLAEIGQVIEQDLGMSAKVLQLVNSGYFGLMNRVTSPTHAVCLLGLNVIQSLISWFYVGSQFQHMRGDVLSQEKLQQHSLRVSGYVREISRFERFDRHAADELITGGLFHDMGKLILAGNIPEQYAAVLAHAKAANVPEYVAEQEILGATHAEVGGYLLALWGFTNTITESCCYHHSPQTCESDNLTASSCVFAANIFDAELEEDSLPDAQAQEQLQALIPAERLERWRQRCLLLKETIEENKAARR